ncbi:unnamed protein product [Rotaria sp. Silwood2]|nr:unnamed protein product [Rotaria sp. Silwood2]CAF4575851.1 unnamed protein product [Rotaria sp. Silwood2]
MSVIRGFYANFSPIYFSSGLRSCFTKQNIIGFILFILGLDQELLKSKSIQQQRFYLASLCLAGDYSDSMQLIQILTTLGSHLRKLRVDFRCLLNLIIHVENNDRLKRVMLHRYLVYLELDTIYESVVDSGDIRHVIAFLFDNSTSLKHVTILSMWYLKIFESIEDMQLLTEILSSIKLCTQIISIVIYHCIF